MSSKQNSSEFSTFLYSAYAYGAVIALSLVCFLAIIYYSSSLNINLLFITKNSI